MHHVRSALCGCPCSNPSPTLGILVQEKRRNTTLSTAVDSKREKLHTGGGRRLRQRITLTTNDTSDEVTQWRLLQSNRRRPPTPRRPGTGRALHARRPRPATGGVFPPLPARGRRSLGQGGISLRQGDVKGGRGVRLSPGRDPLDFLPPLRSPSHAQN